VAQNVIFPKKDVVPILLIIFSVICGVIVADKLAAIVSVQHVRYGPLRELMEFESLTNSSVEVNTVVATIVGQIIITRTPLYGGAEDAGLENDGLEMA